jgi:hypothetical protein
MNELIHIHNQGAELRADSREVAKLFGLEHKHLRELCEKYHDELEQFGVYPFETAKPGKDTEGGRPEKFAWLNFDHIALLLTLTRSTEQTIPLRVKLLVAFRDARNRLRPIDHALLSIPAVWRRAFEPEFYKALLALYGAEFDASENKPQWVGGWTVKFIYRPLYEKLPEELRHRRKLHAVLMGTDEWRKLHQFIEEHAKENLKKHLIQVTTILETSTSRGDFYERFFSKFYGQKQLRLLDGPDVDIDFSTERGQFFDTLKKAAQPIED